MASDSLPLDPLLEALERPIPGGEPRALEKHIQDVLAIPIPTLVTSERPGLRIDFIYDYETRNRFKQTNAIYHYIDDDVLAYGTPDLVALLERALRKIPRECVTVTDVRLTRFENPQE